MTPTAIFLGATAMTTGAGADTDERPSERDAPGMKAEPMSEGTRSIVCATKEKRICAEGCQELGTFAGGNYKKKLAVGHHWARVRSHCARVRSLDAPCT